MSKKSIITILVLGLTFILKSLAPTTSTQRVLIGEITTQALNDASEDEEVEYVVPKGKKRVRFSPEVQVTTSLIYPDDVEVSDATQSEPQRKSVPQRVPRSHTKKRTSTSIETRIQEGLLGAELLGENELIEAIRAEDLAKVTTLITKGGMSPNKVLSQFRNQPDSLEHTPFVIAVKENKTNVVTRLLSSGSISQDTFMCALQVSITTELEEMERLLIREGFHLHPKLPGELLHILEEDPTCYEWQVCKETAQRRHSQEVKEELWKATLLQKDFHESEKFMKEMEISYRKEMLLKGISYLIRLPKEKFSVGKCIRSDRVTTLMEKLTELQTTKDPVEMGQKIFQGAHLNWTLEEFPKLLEIFKKGQVSFKYVSLKSIKELVQKAPHLEEHDEIDAWTESLDYLSHSNFEKYITENVLEKLLSWGYSMRKKDSPTWRRIMKAIFINGDPLILEEALRRILAKEDSDISERIMLEELKAKAQVKKEEEKSTVVQDSEKKEEEEKSTVVQDSEKKEEEEKSTVVQDSEKKKKEEEEKKKKEEEEKKKKEEEEKKKEENIIILGGNLSQYLEDLERLLRETEDQSDKNYLRVSKVIQEKIQQREDYLKSQQDFESTTEKGVATLAAEGVLWAQEQLQATMRNLSLAEVKSIIVKTRSPRGMVYLYTLAIHHDRLDILEELERQTWTVERVEETLRATKDDPTKLIKEACKESSFELIMFLIHSKATLEDPQTQETIWNWLKLENLSASLQSTPEDFETGLSQILETLLKEVESLHPDVFKKFSDKGPTSLFGKPFSVTDLAFTTQEVSRNRTKVLERGEVKIMTLRVLVQKVNSLGKDYTEPELRSWAQNILLSRWSVDQSNQKLVQETIEQYCQKIASPEIKVKLAEFILEEVSKRLESEHRKDIKMANDTVVTTFVTTLLSEPKSSTLWKSYPVGDLIKNKRTKLAHVALSNGAKIEANSSRASMLAVVLTESEQSIINQVYQYYQTEEEKIRALTEALDHGAVSQVGLEWIIIQLNSLSPTTINRNKPRAQKILTRVCTKLFSNTLLVEVEKPLTEGYRIQCYKAFEKALKVNFSELEESVSLLNTCNTNGFTIVFAYMLQQAKLNAGQKNELTDSFFDNMTARTDYLMTLRILAQQGIIIRLPEERIFRQNFLKHFCKNPLGIIATLRSVQKTSLLNEQFISEAIILACQQLNQTIIYALMNLHKKEVSMQVITHLLTRPEMTPKNWSLIVLTITPPENSLKVSYTLLNTMFKDHSQVVEKAAVKGMSDEQFKRWITPLRSLAKHRNTTDKISCQEISAKRSKERQVSTEGVPSPEMPQIRVDQSPPIEEESPLESFQKDKQNKTKRRLHNEAVQNQAKTAAAAERKILPVKAHTSPAQPKEGLFGSEEDLTRVDQSHPDEGEESSLESFRQEQEARPRRRNNLVMQTRGRTIARQGVRTQKARILSSAQPKEGLFGSEEDLTRVDQSHPDEGEESSLESFQQDQRARPGRRRSLAIQSQARVTARQGVQTQKARILLSAREGGFSSKQPVGIIHHSRTKITRHNHKIFVSS